MKRLLVALVVLMGATISVSARGGTQGGLADCSGTVGTTSTAFNPVPFAYLMLANPAAPGGTNIGVSVSPVTAQINASGTMTLAPGQSFTFETDLIPTNGFNIIGSASSTPYTCWKG